MDSTSSANNLLTEELKALVQDNLIAGVSAEEILTFVHNLFPHGEMVPESLDPFTIFNAGMQGMRMRCVEYSLLAAALLNTFGTSARIVAGLATNPAVPDEFSGHVFVEYWDKDVKEWAMSDVQWGVTPVYNKKKLSALQLRNCLDSGKNIEFMRYRNLRPDAQNTDYKAWITPYTDIFDTPGVLPIERRVSVKKHVARARISLPRHGLDRNYEGVRSSNITVVLPEDFYAPPL